jgi:Pyridoxamine 5'-phosphate oxidase
VFREASERAEEVAAMATSTATEHRGIEIHVDPETTTGREASDHRGGPSLTSGDIWKAIAKHSFAVLSYVTPAGQPRSSGIVYATNDRRLYVAVAPDSWKAKHVAASGRAALTVPVRRGGLLSMVLPIPPATISFHGTAVVHPAGSPEIASVLERLGSLLPKERRASASIVEIIPRDAFATYGVGVSLMKMRDPTLARARVPCETRAAVIA